MATDYNHKNRVYQKRDSVWRYNSDHYAGGRNLADSPYSKEYLFQFGLEDDDAYVARLKRSKGLFDNLIARALGVYQSQIFRRDPVRKLPESLKPMQDDVDMNETDASPFFQMVAEQAQVHGLSFVLVDAPRVDGTLTEMDRQSGRLRPWFEHVSALNLYDWDVEIDDPTRRGMLNYIVICDKIDFGKKPFTKEVERKRYRVWKPDSWEVWLTPEGGSADPTMLDSGPNALGEVPLVPFYDRRIAPMQGSTIVDDVALASNSLWNAASVRDEAFQYQGFNQLVLTTDQNISELKLGESRAIKLPLGASAAYLTPSSVPFEAYQKLVNETLEKVADLVFARTSRQLPTGQVESADKRDIDRQEFVALLNRKSSNFQDAEKLCWVLASQYLNVRKEKAREEIDVEYNREFRVNERSMAEWIQGIRESIFSREEVYMAFHPGVDEDEAKKRVDDNLKLERERNPIFQQADGLGAPDVGDPDEDLDNTAKVDKRAPLRAVEGGGA
jgi:hypothetical protein